MLGVMARGPLGLRAGVFRAALRFLFSGFGLPEPERKLSDLTWVLVVYAPSMGW